MKLHEKTRAVRPLRLAVPLVVLLLVLSTASAAAPGSSDLKITKTDSPDPVRVGSTLSYLIGVEDLGPQTATGVTVTDSLPKSVDLVSAKPSVGTCSAHGQKVTCSLGTVGNGVNYGPAPTVTLAVIPRQAGTITNTATVKGGQKDPVASNNKATATTQVLAAPTCRGVTATITGTPGDDAITGTEGPDVIVALGGNDTIRSLAGRDLICAGAGRDAVIAGTAADRVLAGAGADRVRGGGGPDALRGGAGNDVLRGGRGADRLRGGSGFDRCSGGPGADSIRGCER